MGQNASDSHRYSYGTDADEIIFRPAPTPPSTPQSGVMPWHHAVHDALAPLQGENSSSSGHDRSLQSERAVPRHAHVASFGGRGRPGPAQGRGAPMCTSDSDEDPNLDQFHLGALKSDSEGESSGGSSGNVVSSSRSSHHNHHAHSGQGGGESHGGSRARPFSKPSPSASVAITSSFAASGTQQASGGSVEIRENWFFSPSPPNHRSFMDRDMGRSADPAAALPGMGTSPGSLLTPQQQQHQQQYQQQYQQQQYQQYPSMQNMHMPMQHSGSDPSAPFPRHGQRGQSDDDENGLGDEPRRSGSGMTVLIPGRERSSSSRGTNAAMVHAVRAAFPSMSVEEALAALARHNFDVAACIEHLVGVHTASLPRSPSSTTSSSSSSFFEPTEVLPSVTTAPRNVDLSAAVSASSQQQGDDDLHRLYHAYFVSMKHRPPRNSHF